MTERWWRAEDKRYANYDEWAEFDQPEGSHLVVEVRSYRIVKHTPMGVFIVNDIGEQIYIRGKAHKQFAVPTKELALRDLVIRKERHVDGCNARLAQAREHLFEAQYKLKLEMEKSK